MKKSVLLATLLPIVSANANTPWDSSSSGTSTSSVSAHGELRAAFGGEFEGDEKVFATDVTRAVLGLTYSFDSTYSASVAYNIDTNGEALLYLGRLRQMEGANYTEIGFVSDTYIDWLNAATSLDWVSSSLTSFSGFRDSRYLGMNHSRKWASSEFVLSLQNGDDNALSNTALIDSSLQLSAAYKTELNPTLQGYVYALYKMKDEGSASVNSRESDLGLGAALGGGIDSLKILGEIAWRKVQTTGADAVLGFGATGSYMFAEGKSFYARFFGGNEAWKTLIGAKNQFGFGLINQVSKNVSYGGFLEFANTTPDITTFAGLKLVAKY